MLSPKQLAQTARLVRLQILEMIMKSRSSHIGSSFSVVDILVGLYFGIMKINPRAPYAVDRDRLILSKGHAAAALYAVLAERGYFNKKILRNFYSNGSTLPGHASFHCVPGVEVSTGSLGHGLPLGNGIAIAAKKDKAKYRTFVVMSDGECDEGSTWEAILFAGHHKLDNLVAVVDYNKWQSFGTVKEVMDLEPFTAKWRDFGWSVAETDGHNIASLLKSLRKIPFTKGKPSVLVCHTIKGKGLSFMENKLESHYRAPTKEEYSRATSEL